MSEERRSRGGTTNRQGNDYPRMYDETKSLKPYPQPENKSTPGPAQGGSGTSSSSKEDREPEQKKPRKNLAATKQKAARIALWVGAALLLLLVIGLIPRLIQRHHLAAEKKNQENDLPTVTVVEVKAVAPTVDLELSGTMSALTEAPVLARADGYLIKRLVDIGDRVRKDQVMAIVDSPDLDQQVAQARAGLRESESAYNGAQSALDQAKANKGLAEVSAQRWQTLQDKGAVSRQENDGYQTNFKAQSAVTDASQANVASASHNIASSEANLQRLIELQGFEQVRSPFDGIVTERNLDTGALIAASSTLLYRVAQIDVLRTYIEVPQTNAPVVKVGQAVAVNFAEYPGHSFMGAVTRTAQSLDPTTRTMLTEVQLPNTDRALLPGMYATVKLTVPTMGSAVLIPGESMMVRATGPMVAVVDDQNTIHVKQIDVGHDYGNTVEVLSGLSAGEKVIVNPGDNALEGVKVNPVVSKDQKPPTTGSGAPGQAAPKSEQQGQSQSEQSGQGGATGQGGQSGQSEQSQSNSKKDKKTKKAEEKTDKTNK
jgi:RND family efflux transporter MFP subunit